MGFFGDTFGLRGEYRYFRNFRADDAGFLNLEPGTFSTSRVSAGIVLRFWTPSLESGFDTVA